MSSLSLESYNGMLLTEAEILLSKYYDEKKKAFYSHEEVYHRYHLLLLFIIVIIVKDVMRERMYLVQTQRLLEVPSIRDTYKKEEETNNITTNDNVDKIDDDNGISMKANNIEELKRKYDDSQNIEKSSQQKKEKTNKVEIEKTNSEKKVLQPPPPQPSQSQSKQIAFIERSQKPTKISKKIEDIDSYISDEDDSIPDFYSSSSLLQNIEWNPSILNIGKSWVLNDFNFNYRQTVVLKVSVPSTAMKWTINICPSNENGLTDILFHFNFRQTKRHIVLNDKVGTWGGGIKLKYPIIKTPTFEVIIQFRKEGFCLFIDNNFWGILSHRRNINELKDLVLTIPPMGDDFEYEEVLVHKIWWGYKSPEFDVIPTEKLQTHILDQQEMLPETPYYDRTLFISGLPTCTDREVQYSQEIALKEIFPELEAVSVIPYSNKAFVRFPTPNHVDSTIEDFEGEMQMAGEKGGMYVLKLAKMTDQSVNI